MAHVPLPRKIQKPGLSQVSATGARRDCPKVFEKVAPHFLRLQVNRRPHGSLPQHLADAFDPARRGMSNVWFGSPAFALRIRPPQGRTLHLRSLSGVAPDLVSGGPPDSLRPHNVRKKAHHFHRLRINFTDHGPLSYLILKRDEERLLGDRGNPQ